MKKKSTVKSKQSTCPYCKKHKKIIMVLQSELKKYKESAKQKDNSIKKLERIFEDVSSNLKSVSIIMEHEIKKSK